MSKYNKNSLSGAGTEPSPNNVDCTNSCDCQTRLLALEKQLHKVKAQRKHQKLWTKYVQEWLLHKFGK